MYSNRFLCWVGLIIACVSGPKAGAASQRFLFLDPALLADSRNVAVAVNPAQRRETIIRAEQPWEKLMISFYLTVLDDGGKLRMWYICRDKENKANVAYAESADGITWIKPNLGIVDYHGSKENNLVGLTSLEGVVFKDPNAAEAQRYAYVTNAPGGLMRYHSPDGLHWQRDPTLLLKYASDTQNVTIWDERLQAYVLFFRGWDVSQPTAVRTVVRATLPNLTQTVEVPYSATGRHAGADRRGPRYPSNEFPTVFRADAQDPARTDVYNMSAVRYPLDPTWYVGFPSFLRRTPESWAPTYKGSSRGPVEVQVTGSKDGVTWQRYDRAAYAPPGMAAPDKKNMTFMGTGMVVRNDELWQYGTEFESEHGDMAARQKKTDGVIVRWVQRVDGFVSANTGNEEGRARTVPVKVSGEKLRLNLDTGALGELRVGLIDDAEKPIAGFGIEQCDPIQINSTGAVVTWAGKSDVSELRNKDVRLEFGSRRTKLYSFRFE